MADIEIKRGYEVLPDNNIRFGIRITNVGDLAISDVEVILDYSESLFKLEGDRLHKVGVIPPAGTRTAEFILKPLGCVHKVNIEALISFRDAKYMRQRIDMHPKEVHCVCPFLKGKAMPKAEFFELSSSGHSAESGLNFKGVSVERLVSFLVQTCKSRHHKVDDYSVDGGKMLYLASESIGEKAYYLLTALIKDDDGLTRVMLRAVSDKPHGLNGFLNEIVSDLRHVVSSVQSAQEIGFIKKQQVINIIDSIVQRSSFGGIGGEGEVSVNIQDSVVQRTEFNVGEVRGVEEKKILHRKEAQEVGQERKAEGARKDKIGFVGQIKNPFKEEEGELHLLDEKEVQAEHERKALEGWGKKVKENIERKKREEEKLRILEEDDRHEKSVDESNSIGMKFIYIPAGEFMMGSNEYNREKPVHKVKIDKPFYLGTYPVTQREWKAVMGNNPSDFKGDDLPVEMISWADVRKFIRRLNKKEGTDKYRLPSESEWEYACRAGTTTRYCFGDSELKLGEYAWYDSNSNLDRKTHPVGQKKPNLWGLYDMHGNVWEWVQDELHDNYISAPSNGGVWENGSSSHSWVIRGGSWNNISQYCRSAVRNFCDSANYHRFIGFRLLHEF